MYNATTFFTILTIFSTFLFWFPRFAKLNLYIYSIFYISSAFTRPYHILGIDNGYLAQYLTDKTSWGFEELFKYFFVYNLTLPFQNYKVKFFVIILISLIIIFIALKRIITFLRNSESYSRNWNKYTFLILFLLPCITSSLYMVHLRQFFSFSIVLLMNAYLIKKSKNNLLIITILMLLIALTHPIYLLYFLTISPFYLNYYPFIKHLNRFLKKIYCFFLKFRKLVLIPLVFILFAFGNQLYLVSVNLLPVFAEYGNQRDNISNSQLFFIPFVLILSINFITTNYYKSLLIRDPFSQISNISTNSLKLYNYILITLVLMLFSAEFFTPSIYSIGRIKSALYPNIFFNIFLLGYASSKSRLFLISGLLIIFFGLALAYGFFQRLSGFVDPLLI